MQDILRKRVANLAGKTVLIYLLSSIVWLLTVGWLVSSVIKDPDVLLALNTYKEWLLIALTSSLLLVVMRGVEKTIEQTETRSKILLEAIPDIVFRFDVDGIFVDYSAIDKSSLVVPPEEFLGKNITEVLPQEIALPMMEAIKKALKTGKVETFEYSVQTPKGLMFSEARVVAKNGEVVAFVRDVTEKTRSLEAIKQSEEKFSQVFNNNPEIMWISTLDRGVFFDVNEAFVSELGYLREEVVGKSVLEVNVWEDLNMEKQMVEELKVNEAINNRVTKFKGKDGKVIYLLCSMSFVSVNGVKCILFLGVNMVNKTGPEKKW